MARITRNLSLDAGIEQILTRSDPFPSALPDTGRMMPGIDRVGQRLDEVLFPPSVEEELLESFRPEVDQREILTPNGYRAALEESQAELREAVARAKGTPAGDSLQRAVALLDEERELRDLLSTYRHLLHKA